MWKKGVLKLLIYPCLWNLDCQIHSGQWLFSQMPTRTLAQIPQKRLHKILRVEWTGALTTEIYSLVRHSLACNVYGAGCYRCK